MNIDTAIEIKEFYDESIMVFHTAKSSKDHKASPSSSPSSDDDCLIRHSSTAAFSFVDINNDSDYGLGTSLNSHDITNEMRSPDKANLSKSLSCDDVRDQVFEFELLDLIFLKYGYKPEEVEEAFDIYGL